jgi:hypothetical protein
MLDAQENGVQVDFFCADLKGRSQRGFYCDFRRHGVWFERSL